MPSLSSYAGAVVLGVAIAGAIVEQTEKSQPAAVEQQIHRLSDSISRVRKNVYFTFSSQDVKQLKAEDDVEVGSVYLVLREDTALLVEGRPGSTPPWEVICEFKKPDAAE